MADPVLKFPPEQKGAPSGAPTKRLASEPRRRLLAGGHRVTVYNRTREKAEALIPDGALLADDVAELAGCDVVFTCVSSSPDLEQVTVGDGGLLRQDRVHSVIVDSSTVSAEGVTVTCS